jgi:hypothetical protein
VVGTLGMEVDKRVRYLRHTERGKQRRIWQKRSSRSAPLEHFVIKALPLIMVGGAICRGVERRRLRGAQCATTQEQKSKECGTYHRSPIEEADIAAPKVPGKRHRRTFSS